MYDFVHGRLSEMIFIDTDIDAPTPEGEMPGECKVKPSMSVSFANTARKKKEAKKKKREEKINADWVEIDPLLGTLPDWNIAKKFGKSYGAVNARRTKLGIAAYVKPDNFPWAEIDPLLGTESDIDLSRRFGCSAHTIGRRRKKYGIPMFIP